MRCSAVFSGDEALSKIAIISEHYYPYNDNANAACTQCVARGLAQCGNDVTVFTKSFKKEVPAFEEKDGYKIVRYFYRKQEKIDNRFGIKSNGIFSNLFVAFMTSFIYKIETKKQRNFYAEKIEKIDYVLSVSNPFMNHETARIIKKKVPNIKWIAYYYDPYSFNNVKNIFEKSYRKIHEKNTLKSAEKIVLLDGILQGYANEKFSPFLCETFETTLPTLSIESLKKKEKHDKIRLVYIGRFYKNIRKPDFLLKVLSELDCEEYEAMFYGSCCEYLEENFNTLPDCVALCGNVNNEECKSKIADADIVLNVGNENINQLPSKIFEYISFGKPILNFYSNDNDTSVNFLQNYPAVLNIKNDSCYDIKQVENFCKNTKEIDKEISEKIYSDYLSENVIRKIDDFIKK